MSEENEIDAKSYSDFLFYSSEDGTIKIQIIQEGETVWATQKSIAEIFNVSRVTITEHLQNIFKSFELQEDKVCRKIRHTAEDGKTYLTNFYNLDVIISVGYRVNSIEATRFRQWATNVLKEYLVKGFALDDERLKKGKALFGKDYFDELLERIREIRASERRFYLKVTDIYEQCSVDYDKKSPITTTFFKTVQNKLEYAITHQTAAEIIRSRADASKPHMGLTTYKNAAKGGKVQKSDVSIAKNYLTEPEISELNAIVNMYLDYAENQARRNKLMKMADWVEKLDAFLKFNEYDILTNAGKIRSDIAKAFAEKEFSKFRVVQDREYKSDYDKFDKVASKIKETGELPKEEEKKEDTDFDKTLKGILSVPKPPKD